jgi:hypothetical protein
VRDIADVHSVDLGREAIEVNPTCQDSA